MGSEGPVRPNGGAFRAFALGATTAAIGPMLLGLALALGVLPSDPFWLVAPLGMVPLAGVAVGAVVRATPVGRHARAAALSVPVGLGLGWAVALLVTAPLDPSGEAPLAMLFALLSQFVLPWWVLPLLLAMGLAWLVARGGWRPRSDYL
jgi:hypothetical protein